jgi:hypothetical protein
MPLAMKVGRFGLGELFAILGGAAAIAAVFHPWYSFRLSAEASELITRQSGLDPLQATFLQQGLNAGFASQQPTAWELFDRTDWVLLVIGAIVVLTAVLAVVGAVDRPQARMLLLGGSAIIAVGYRIAIPPVDDAAVEVGIATWGWVALGGSIAIALSATIPPPSAKPKPATSGSFVPTPEPQPPAFQPMPATGLPGVSPYTGAHTGLVGGAAMPAGFATGGARGPGWYDDPEGPGMLRYWDGGRWTWDTRKASAAVPAAPTPPKTA